MCPPDDESFGLGALVTALRDAGAEVGLVCCTAGEASTLGAGEDLGRLRADELDRVIHVDRTRQRRAIACHGSQLADNPGPHRRIELSGDTEALRLLHDPR